MSEVGEASQLVIAAGRGAYLLSGITLKAAIQFLKLIHTVYLSKWKGKTFLGRLRSIKGEDMMYLNVGTEDRKMLKKIQKEMKKHGILFARMPDLCGGDGRTQYAVSVSDAPRVRALLINHAMGPYKDVYMGMLSEKDYLSTAFTRSGNLTPETRELLGGMERTADRQENAPEKDRSSQEYGTPEKQMHDLKQAFDDVRIRVRDLDCQGRQNEYQWIFGDPVDVKKNFAEFKIGEGRSVFIPVRDTVLPGKGREGRSGGVIFKDRAYTVTDLQTATFQTLAGPAVIALVKEAAVNRNSGAATVGNRQISREQKKESPGTPQNGKLEGPVSALENLGNILNRGSGAEIPSPFEKKL